MMSLFLTGEVGALGLLLLALPGPFAAIRYARMANFREAECDGIPALPGLPTITYALSVVALVFLQRETMLDQTTTAWLLFAGAPTLSGLMVAPIRYPKLGACPWIAYPILAGLMVMPFYETPRLVRVMVMLIVSYIFISPLLVGWRLSRAGARDAKSIGEGAPLRGPL
jgi:phosphatidylserine synthase